MPQEQPDAVETKAVDPQDIDEETPAADVEGDDEGDDAADRKPTPYELKLRKENEKRRKAEEDAKAKVAAYEEKERKAAEEKLKSEGKYKELLAEKEAELLHAQDKAARYDILEAGVRADLLEKLPKSKREKYADIDVDLLREIVTDFAAEEKKAPGSPGVDQPSTRNPTPKGWWEMTSAEQAEMLTRDPTGARALMRESGLQNRKRFR
jgi:colicin import membrane protein